MVYGNNRIIDKKSRLRPDNLEQDRSLQERVSESLDKINQDNLHILADVKGFIDDFMKINGFNYDNVDYTADIDMEVLSKLKLF